MRRVPLGTTGRTISALAYGCMSLCEERRDSGIEAVAKALELGINCFDNANMYPRPDRCGESERILGAALQAAGAKREDIVVTSKCAILFPGMEKEFTYKAYNLTDAYVKEQVDTSLRNLQMDYLDILFFHRIDYLVHPQELAATCQDLLDSGKVRSIGVSNFTVAEMRALHAHCPLSVLQTQFSLLHQEAMESGLHATCTEFGQALFAWSPLQGGQLAGRNLDRHADWRSQRAEGVYRQVATMAAEYGTDAATLALAWLMHWPGPVVPLVGTASAAHIAAAAAACELQLRRDHWYELMVIGRGRPVPWYQAPMTFLNER